MTAPITDHEYRPDRAGQWFTGRCDKCGEPRSAHMRCTVHDETYTTVCRACRADEIAADAS